MTKKHITKATLILTIMAMALTLFGGVARADIDIPTVDEGEINRMFDLTSEGPGSDGCDDLKSEIGAAANQVRTWTTERELASSWQEKSMLNIKIRNGLKWIRYASIIYDTNCSYAFFGGMEGPMS